MTKTNSKKAPELQRGFVGSVTSAMKDYAKLKGHNGWLAAHKARRQLAIAKEQP